MPLSVLWGAFGRLGVPLVAFGSTLGSLWLPWSTLGAPISSPTGCVLSKLVDWLGFPVQFQSSPSLVTNIWKKPVVFALKWIQFNPFQFQFDIPETNPVPV